MGPLALNGQQPNNEVYCKCGRKMINIGQATLWCPVCHIKEKTYAHKNYRGQRRFV